MHVLLEDYGKKKVQEFCYFFSSLNTRLASPARKHRTTGQLLQTCTSNCKLEQEPKFWWFAMAHSCPCAICCFSVVLAHWDFLKGAQVPGNTAK